MRIPWYAYTAFCAGLCLAAVAMAHDPTGHGAYTEWYTGQRQENGVSLCCGDIDERGGDAHFVDVMQKGDQFFVKVGAEWVLYPKSVIPYMYNPTGHNIAWYNQTAEGLTWYCLRLSTGS